MEKSKRWGILCLLVVSFCALQISGCGGADTSDASGVSADSLATTPQQAYAKIVASVEKGDFGALYDLMDSTYKQYWVKMVEVNLAQLDRLDSAERQAWGSLQNISDPREAFVQYMSQAPGWWSYYRGAYEVLRVDTIVTVVTSHGGAQPQATYYRLENGSYHLTAPPQSLVASQVQRIPTSEPPAKSEGANKR